MSWMSVVRWGQPKVSRGPMPKGILKRRNQLGWQEVLSTVAQVEMELKRLHATKLYDQGKGVHGTVHLELMVEPKEEGGVAVVRVESDPALDIIKDEIGHIVANNAKWPHCGLRIRVEVSCTFDSASSTGWGQDDFGVARDGGLPMDDLPLGAMPGGDGFGGGDDGFGGGF